MTGESMGRASEILRERLRMRVGDYRSQREMAERIGIAEGTLSRWLKPDGRPNPDLSELENISDELCLKISELLDDDPENPNNLDQERQQRAAVHARLTAEVQRWREKHAALKRRLRGALDDDGDRR